MGDDNLAAPITYFEDAIPGRYRAQKFEALQVVADQCCVPVQADIVARLPRIVRDVAGLSVHRAVDRKSSRPEALPPNR